jgi:hypothetical protein
MKTSMRFLSLLIILSFAIQGAYADTIKFVATGPALPGLAGPNESPVNSSPGTGIGTVIFDTVTQMMTVDISFSGLVPLTTGGAPSGTTASHIHCCIAAPGTAIVATTTPTFPGFPLGVDSGTYHQTFDMTSAGSYNPSFITAHGGTVSSAEADLLAGMLAGQTYLNIHSTAFPGGEIRGFLQVVPVPEPATVSLVALGLLFLGPVIRRRGQS